MSPSWAVWCLPGPLKYHEYTSYSCLLDIMAGPGFVTKDMVPREWLMTPSQEREWLIYVAPRLPGVDAEALQRMVAVELLDVGLSWEYQKAYLEAAKRRDDLLAPVITSQEQWQGREDKVVEIVKCLWEGTAAAVVFMALAVLKK